MRRLHILPDVSSPRGAPMGRCSNITCGEEDHPVKFNMEKLKLYDGDYDQGGAYWGHTPGTAIFWARGDGIEEVQELFVRATSRADAKAQVRGTFPNARFYK